MTRGAPAMYRGARPAWQLSADDVAEMRRERAIRQELELEAERAERRKARRKEAREAARRQLLQRLDELSEAQRARRHEQRAREARAGEVHIEMRTRVPAALANAAKTRERRAQRIAQIIALTRPFEDETIPEPSEEQRIAREVRAWRGRRVERLEVLPPRLSVPAEPMRL